MQIKKTYREINPNLLYDEVKEFVQNQGLSPDQNKMETYSIPTDSSIFTYRGTLIYKIQGKEALKVHILGADKGETKMMLDSNDQLFAPDKVAALVADLEFMLGSYEIAK
jgi:hypothetical protein